MQWSAMFITLGGFNEQMQMQQFRAICLSRFLELFIFVLIIIGVPGCNGIVLPIKHWDNQVTLFTSL